jgi:hypothetical protein
MPDDGSAGVLVIEDGSCCATAETRRMSAAVRMSDDDGCTLSTTADNERKGGTLARAPCHHLAQRVDDGH